MVLSPSKDKAILIKEAHPIHNTARQAAVMAVMEGRQEPEVVPVVEAGGHNPLMVHQAKEDQLVEGKDSVNQTVHMARRLLEASQVQAVDSLATNVKDHKPQTIVTCLQVLVLKAPLNPKLDSAVGLVVSRRRRMVRLVLVAVLAVPAVRAGEAMAVVDQVMMMDNLM